MAFTHRITRGWEGGGVSVMKSVSKTDNAEINQDIPVPGASTNLLANLAIDVSQLASVFLVCDRDITIKTNSSGSPADTIALKAGVAIAWIDDDASGCPFTVDVTALYLTLAAGDAATLQIRALLDATP